MLGAGQVFQAVDTQVTQKQPWGQLVANKDRGAGGDQDLPAVSHAAQPRTAVRRRAVVVTISQVGFAGVQRHAHPKWLGEWPGLRLQAALDRDGGQDRRASAVEDSEAAVALAAGSDQ